jgi:hypothetical protein
MHEQGIIGYFAGKNGVGVRIFINRASSSIGVRKGRADEKILAFPLASSLDGGASAGEPAFSDSYAVLDVLEININPRAPKNGADKTQFSETSFPLSPRNASHLPPVAQPATANSAASVNTDTIRLNELVLRLKSELEPALREAARQAATREHEKTREWLENRGLPKAARVAQHEAYNVLRKHGVIGEPVCGKGPWPEVGRGSYTQPEARPLSGDEVDELAQGCVAMLETQGQSIERTTSEMSVEAGGFLLSDDVQRVREKAGALARTRADLCGAARGN